MYKTLHDLVLDGSQGLSRRCGSQESDSGSGVGGAGVGVEDGTGVDVGSGVGISVGATVGADDINVGNSGEWWGQSVPPSGPPGSGQKQVPRSMHRRPVPEAS